MDINTTISTTPPKPSLLEKATVLMIGFFAFLQVYSVQAILPVLMEQMGASAVQVGMAVGATVLAIALMSPFMGMLSDAYGRKKFIVVALIALAIPTAMVGLSKSINTLSFWRFLQGFGIPGISVVLIAYISEEYKSQLASMMSLYVSGTVLGGFSGRFFAGHLETLIGWRAGYLVMALMTLIGALWAWRMLPSSRHFVASSNFKESFSTLLSHTKNPYVISSCVLGACVLFSLVGCFTFINLHLAAAPYELTPADLANLFTLYLIGMVITPLSARLITRFGMTTTMLLAVGASVTGMLITLAVPMSVIILGLVIMSSGVFITQSATISYITSHVTKGRSLASGLYYMSYYGGGSIGAWVCAYAYKTGQWSMTVSTVIAVQLVALALVFGVMRKQAE